MSSFRNALQHGALLLDGALGTELERRGVATSKPGWTSHAIVENPELITQIHREYIEAGARIITANSFRTNPRAHKKTGLSAEELTKRSVDLARAAGSNAFIAGSIAPAIDSIPPQKVLMDDQELLNEHSQMAKWLDEAKVDLILIETMNTVREAFIALVAAKRHTKLPIAVSLVPASRKHLISGASLVESIDLLAKAGADMLMLNCQSLSVVTPALREFASLCAGAGVKWGVYPNAAERVNGAWVLQVHEDHEFAAFAELALDNDAAIIGGCCGTTPSTTEVMSTVLETMK